jgi:hypothetical protein
MTPDDLVRIVSQLDNCGPGLPTGQLGLAAVHLEEDFLAFGMEAVEIVPVSRLDRVLIDFVTLANATSRDRFLEFARAYGPLFLCEKHGLPALHPTLPDEQVGPSSLRGDICFPKLPSRGDEVGDEVLEQIKTPPEFLEDLEVWRYWARHALAVLKLASQLKGGKSGKSDDWLTAVGVNPANNRERPPMLARAVRRWLRAAPRPQMDLVATDSGRLEVRFISGMSANGLAALRAAIGNRGPLESVYLGGIFSVLAERLTAAVSGGTGKAICSGCAEFFDPPRAPALGRHRFCKKCGKRASWRLSKREARKPKKISKITSSGVANMSN